MRTQSYSSLILYEGCPYSYKLRYIDRLKSAENPAAQRGVEIHSQIEAYLKDETDQLPDCASKLATEYQELKAHKPEVETEWCFDGVVMRLDAVYQSENKIHIIDHKTGKEAPFKHMGQGQFYATGAIQKYPGAEAFKASFYYLDLGIAKHYEFKPESVKKFKQTFQNRIERINNDTLFKPQANRYNCQYCSLRQHCKFDSSGL